MQLRPHQLEALDKMNTKRLGQGIVPTGGGKTMCMIEDAKRRFTQDGLPRTIVELHLVFYLQVGYQQSS